MKVPPANLPFGMVCLRNNQNPFSYNDGVCTVIQIIQLWPRMTIVYSPIILLASLIALDKMFNKPHYTFSSIVLWVYLKAIVIAWPNFLR